MVLEIAQGFREFDALWHVGVGLLRKLRGHFSNPGLPPLGSYPLSSFGNLAI